MGPLCPLGLAWVGKGAVGHWEGDCDWHADVDSRQIAKWRFGRMHARAGGGWNGEVRMDVVTGARQELELGGEMRADVT